MYGEQIIGKPGKINMILYSGRKNNNSAGLGKSKLFGKDIPLKALLNTLLWVLSWLTWNLHINDKIYNAIGIFWLCRNAFGKIWDLSPKASPKSIR